MEEAGSSLVEVGASFAQAYAPVLDFDGWRVAMLRHFAVVSPGDISPGRATQQHE